MPAAVGPQTRDIISTQLRKSSALKPATESSFALSNFSNLSGKSKTPRKKKRNPAKASDSALIAFASQSTPQGSDDVSNDKLARENTKIDHTNKLPTELLIMVMDYLVAEESITIIPVAPTHSDMEKVPLPYTTTHASLGTARRFRESYRKALDSIWRTGGAEYVIRVVNFDFSPLMNDFFAKVQHSTARPLMHRNTITVKLVFTTDFLRRLPENEPRSAPNAKVRLDLEAWLEFLVNERAAAGRPITTPAYKCIGIGDNQDELAKISDAIFYIHKYWNVYSEIRKIFKACFDFADASLLH